MTQEKQEGAPPAAEVQTPKLEIKDGKTLIDGKSYVRESDLMAAKESLTKQMTEAEQAHKAAIDKASLEISAFQAEVAKANAKVTEAIEARNSGAISAEELAKVKAERDTVIKERDELKAGSLEYRRKVLVMAGLSADQVKDRDATQLQALEEALQVLQKSGIRGPGNYATTPTGGAASPVAPIDRARQLLNNTPYRGTREVPAKT